MADTRALTPFGEELSLTRRYLELEQLRLADRLVVDWQIDPATEPALVPSKGKLTVKLGPDLEFLEPPAGKDVDVQMVVDLRRMLSDAGYRPS